MTITKKLKNFAKRIALSSSRSIGHRLFRTSYDPQMCDFVCRLRKQGYHIFGGYYDISLFDPEDRRLAYHQTGQKLSPTVTDACEIRITKLPADHCGDVLADDALIATTRAWSWQQGARLGWAIIDGSKALHFNDFCHRRNVYMSVFYLPSEDKILRSFEVAFYDYSIQTDSFATLNWDRLNFFRPGYGYNCRYFDPSKTAADTDGLFLGRLKDKVSDPLLSFSYQELCSIVGFNPAKSYLNHLKYSPDGQYLLFFLIEQQEKQSRFVAAFVISIETHRLILLTNPKKSMPSHYLWESDALYLTEKNSHGTWSVEKYAAPDFDKHEADFFRRIDFDPHPAPVALDSYLLDTPLDAFGLHHLYKTGRDGLSHRMATLPRPPIYTGAVRCDPHQRSSRTTSYVTIDNVAHGKRCIDVIKLKP